MALVTTYGVTAANMLSDHLPFAPGAVTSSSNGLTTGKLEAWIDEAAGQVTGILQRHGVEVDALSDDALALCRSGVRAYVAAKALSDRHYPPEDIKRAWETWQSVRKTLREDPHSLGDDQVATNQVVSNVDVSDPTTTRFDADQELF